MRGRSQSSGGRPSGNDDFRHNFGFLALMLVCCACLVYLMAVLRSIFRPFLWALFLVMALTPAVSLVESFLLQLGDCVCRCTSAICSFVGTSICLVCSLIPFVDRFLKRQQPQRGVRLQLPVTSPLATSAASAQSKTSKRTEGVRDREVMNPAIVGASINEAAESPGSETQFIDEGNESEHSRDSRTRSPCLRMLVHGVAIAIVVAAVVCAISGFVLMVIQSVLSLQDNWPVYKKGGENVSHAVQGIIAHISGSMPKQVAEDISHNALVKAEELLSGIVTEVLSNAWRSMLEFLMMALYIAFWLSDPMPIGTKVEELFRRYIILKGLVCAGYGSCVGVLLHTLNVDLAPFFGLSAFLLSFVPEVGAIFAVLLPMPVILLDSRLDSPAMTLVVATMAQLALKFVFGNVVEVKLVEADEIMKMHPVIILLAVTFFGLIWGPTGMLLSVPLVAYFKVALLSESVPDCYRDPILVILEGDRQAPARYLRSRLLGSERRRTAGGDKKDDASDIIVADAEGSEPLPRSLSSKFNANA